MMPTDANNNYNSDIHVQLVGQTKGIIASATLPISAVTIAADLITLGTVALVVTESDYLDHAVALLPLPEPFSTTVPCHISLGRNFGSFVAVGTEVILVDLYIEVDKEDAS